MPRPKKWMEQSASSALVHLVLQISLRYVLERGTVIWPTRPSVFKSSVYRLIAGPMIRGRCNALLVPQIGVEPGGRTNTYRLLTRLVGRVPQPGQTTSNAMSGRQGSGRPQALACS